MRKLIATAVVVLGLFNGQRLYAQVDLNNIDIQDIIGKVMHVQKGFAPTFSLGNKPIDQISKVAEILGLKKNEEINRLFKTFKTGRTVYKSAAYVGGAIAVYGIARKLGNSVKKTDGNAALYSGISAISSGLIVKFLTKGASYKAVDIFNGIAVKKIKDIFSIAPASNTAGIGLYVKL